MLCDSLGIGGAETHVVTLALGLIDRQNEVTLISAGGVYEDKLRCAGVEILYAPLNLRDVRSITKSLGVIKKNLPKYDIIHAHTRLSAYLATLARGKYTLPKIVVSAHLNFSKKGLGRFSKWGDITLAVSEDIKEHLIKAYGVNENRIILTKNGIDLREYSGKAQDKKRIVHISRIDSDRALVAFLLCKIAPRLLERYKDYTVDIYGSGDMLAELKTLASKANEALRRCGVVIHGATSDVPRMLEGGGIFVGVSRAALEAMAMRLPTVIAGNEGYGGIICKQNIPYLQKSNFCARGLGRAYEEALIRDIDSLIKNEALYYDCSQTGYETVLRFYSGGAMVDDASNAYMLAMGGCKISVLGYFGFGNLGDEKTLSVLLKALKRKNARVSGIISRSERATKSKSAFSIIKSSDALVLGGGNLLQNETSLSSLLYYTAIILLASVMKKRVIAIASGIGEIKGFIGLSAARLAVRRFYSVGARTFCDMENFRRLGAKSVKLMPDLCFTLENGREKEEEHSFLIIFKDASEISKELIKSITENTALTPVAAVISGGDCCESVNRICKELGIGLKRIESYGELCDIMSCCKFTVTEKLHGAIFSLVNKKICFISTNTSKSRSLYEEISRRSAELKIKSPLFSISDIAVQNIKEVGALDSDFDKLLISLREDIKSSLDTLI